MQQIGRFQFQSLSFYGKSENKQNIQIVLITGNPGIVHFYDYFLDQLYQNLNQEISVSVISLAGHCSQTSKITPYYNLQDQIEHKILYLEHLIKKNKNVQFILIGHSIGSYMIQHIIKKLDNNNILKCYMLFPTFFKMRDSPNGKKMSFLFNQPFRTLCSLISSLTSNLPQILKIILIKLFLWNKYQPDIAESILKLFSYHNSYQALYLASFEMKEVYDLDESLFKFSLNKSVYYFGKKDDWVPKPFYEELIHKFQSSKFQCYIDQQNLEHAFVIGGSKQMSLWLKDQIEQIL